MVCCQLLFRWIRSDILESKKKREEGRSITMKQYYGSLSDRLLSAWACFELILLAFFLYKKQGSGFPNNFLHDLCTIATCPNVLNRMIATKVITAMLLFLGAKWESPTLKLPWFLVNITGFLPFWEILLSCIKDFETVKKAWFSLMTAGATAI